MLTSVLLSTAIKLDNLDLYKANRIRFIMVNTYNMTNHTRIRKSGINNTSICENYSKYNNFYNYNNSKTCCMIIHSNSFYKFYSK